MSKFHLLTSTILYLLANTLVIGVAALRSMHNAADKATCMGIWNVSDIFKCFGSELCTTLTISRICEAKFVSVPDKDMPDSFCLDNLLTSYLKLLQFYKFSSLVQTSIPIYQVKSQSPL